MSENPQPKEPTVVFRYVQGKLTYLQNGKELTPEEYKAYKERTSEPTLQNAPTHQNTPNTPSALISSPAPDEEPTQITSQISQTANAIHSSPPKQFSPQPLETSPSTHGTVVDSFIINGVPGRIICYQNYNGDFIYVHNNERLDINGQSPTEKLLRQHFQAQRSQGLSTNSRISITAPDPYPYSDQFQAEPTLVRPPEPQAYPGDQTLQSPSGSGQSATPRMQELASISTGGIPGFYSTTREAKLNELLEQANSAPKEAPTAPAPNPPAQKLSPPAQQLNSPFTIAPTAPSPSTATHPKQAPIPPQRRHPSVPRPQTPPPSLPKRQKSPTPSVIQKANQLQQQRTKPNPTTNPDTPTPAETVLLNNHAKPPKLSPKAIEAGVTQLTGSKKSETIQAILDGIDRMRKMKAGGNNQISYSDIFTKVIEEGKLTPEEANELMILLEESTTTDQSKPEKIWNLLQSSLQKLIKILFN